MGQNISVKKPGRGHQDHEKAEYDGMIQTRLYMKTPDDSWPMIYSEGYNISFAGLERLHPFDSGKWGRVQRMLVERRMLAEDKFIQPLEASEAELRKVHTENYLRSLTWSSNVARITEVPPVALLPNRLVQMSVLRPFRLQTGGTILAGKLAMERGWAINIGGGFHHCSGDKGGGFCAYADITLNIKYLWENFPDIKKVLIVDLDAHQGNGYARDFLGEQNVYIFDMYNRMIYPYDEEAKQAINSRVELVHGTADGKYLKLVKKHIDSAIAEFAPQYIVYNAGTDILQGDPLGCLDITPNGIIERDRLVFAAARSHNIPIAMLTSGGYQRSTAEVIANSISNLHEQGLISGPVTNVLQTS